MTQHQPETGAAFTDGTSAFRGRLHAALITLLFAFGFVSGGWQVLGESPGQLRGKWFSSGKANAAFKVGARKLAQGAASALQNADERISKAHQPLDFGLSGSLAEVPSSRTYAVAIRRESPRKLSDGFHFQPRAPPASA